MSKASRMRKLSWVALVAGVIVMAARARTPAARSSSIVALRGCSWSWVDLS
jgi:hypothetical protein